MSSPLWFTNFLYYCLQVILLVLAGTALPALFRLRAPRVLLAYWQGLLVACLVLPLIQPWKFPAPAASSADGSVSISFQGAAGAASEAHAWIFPLIAGLLAAGALARLLWLGLGLEKLREIRRSAEELDPLPGCLHELQSRLGVNPGWYLAPAMESPATFGIRPPSILLPQSFPTLNESSQRAIAGHELLHVARRDWIFNLLEEIVLSLFWFHPAVAWVVNRVRLTREQTVDEEAVRRFSARKPYMSALLEIASGGPGLAPGAAPTFLKERQLAQRIELLVKEVRMSETRLFLSVSTISVLLVLAGVLSVWAFPLRAPVPEAISLVGGNGNPADTSDVIPPVKKVQPVYPVAAKKAGIQGIVKLRVTLAKDGSVSDLQIISGPPELAGAAVTAVQQWHYAPSAEVRVTVVTINFSLAKDGAPAQRTLPESPSSAKAAPVVVSKVIPVYPLEAKKAGIEGNVVLRTTIAKDGSVSHLDVVSGNTILAKAAVTSVQQWRYEPQVTGSTVTSVTINFTLAKDGSAITPSSASDQPGPRVFSSHDNGVTPPVPTYKPEPPYTKEARAAKLQGTVDLQIIIGADGSVTEVKADQGFDKGLTQNAMDTIKTWNFKPAMKAGKPVPWQGKVEVSFRLF